MGSDCSTEEELDKALTEKASGLRFIEAHTERMDGPECTLSLSSIFFNRVLTLCRSTQGLSFSNVQEESHQGLIPCVD